MPLMNLGMGSWQPSQVVQSDDEVNNLWNAWNGSQQARIAGSQPLTQQQLATQMATTGNFANDAAALPYLQNALKDNGGAFYKDWAINNYGPTAFAALQNYTPDYSLYNANQAEMATGQQQYQQFMDARNAARGQQAAAYQQQLGGGFTGGLMGSDPSLLSPQGTNDPAAGTATGSQTPWSTPGFGTSIGAYNPSPGFGTGAGWGQPLKSVWG